MDMKYRIIELFEKTTVDGFIYLIAECNEYQGEIRIKQFSRSPFVFPDTMTDQEIVDSIQQNEYKIYF
jgi:hypothetical protein